MTFLITESPAFTCWYFNNITNNRYLIQEWCHHHLGHPNCSQLHQTVERIFWYKEKLNIFYRQLLCWTISRLTFMSSILADSTPAIATINILLITFNLMIILSWMSSLTMSFTVFSPVLILVCSDDVEGCWWCSFSQRGCDGKEFSSRQLWDVSSRVPLYKNHSLHGLYDPDEGPPIFVKQPDL